MDRLRRLVRRDLHRVGPRRPARQVRRGGKQRGDLLPAGRGRIDEGARRHRVAPGRRNRACGHHLPQRGRALGGRSPDDRRGRHRDGLREALPRGDRRRGDRRLRRRRGSRGESCAGPERPAPGMRHRDHPGPRPAGRLPALRRPGLLAGRQGRDHHLLHQGRRRGRTDRRSGQGLARHDREPRRRPAGQDHRRRRLLRRCDRSLRRHQRDPAAGRGQPRHLPADHHLPLADVLADPAGGGDVRRDALALARLRDLRARGHHQRPVELDHVGAGAGRGDRLCPFARLEISRGASPHGRQARGDEGRARLRRGRRSSPRR